MSGLIASARPGRMVTYEPIVVSTEPLVVVQPLHLRFGVSSPSYSDKTIPQKSDMRQDRLSKSLEVGENPISRYV